MAGSRYDFVIVGAGSAGCVLANRLSADPGNRVLLLEAGRPDHLWDVFVHMPAALGFPVGSRFHDWCYESEPEPHMHGRRLAHPRGKLLGGCSSINAMVFQRGHPLDFDRWGADPGMRKWDYAHCLPYFRRLERATIEPRDAARGYDGPQRLEPGPVTNPLFGALFDAAAQAGHALVGDINGLTAEGFAPFDRTIHRGRRISAARAFVHPVRDRPNLEVRCNAHVTKVVFAGRRAVGVRYGRPGGRAHEVRAAEVILAGGALNSPQLLQLSGVGDAAELASLGVPVLLDLPAVGENLQDHLAVHLQHRCTQPVTLGAMRNRRNWPGIAAKWLFGRCGPGATNMFEAGGFVRSNETMAYPDLQLGFAPVAMRFDDTAEVVVHGYGMHVGAMMLEARGRVRITSADPWQPPAMRFNYLSTEADRRFWVDAMGIARDILGRPAFDELNAGETYPGPGVSTDDAIVDWVARTAQTGLHPSCTCPMGTDDRAVLNPASMRVHGLDGIRVVDASAMPYCPNGATHAPTMMLAEKAADLILGNSPQAPEYPGRAGRWLAGPEQLPAS